MSYSISFNLATQIAFIILTTIAVTFRFIAAHLIRRGRKRSSPALSTDVCILLSLLFIGAGAGISIYRCRLQRDAAARRDGLLFIEPVSINLQDIPTVMKGLLAESFTYVTALWMVKFALVFMIFDIHRFLGKRLRQWLYFCAAFTFACFIGLITMGFTKCVPFDRNWTIGTSFCTPITKPVIIALTILTIVNDIFIFAIPVLLVRSLHLPSSILLAIAFTLVFFITGTVLAILRIVVTLPYTSVDYTDIFQAFSVSSIGKVEFFSAIQLALNLIIVCIPQYRLLFRRAKSGKLGGLFGGRRRSECDSSTGTSGMDQRNEILGLLPKEVGQLVIMKTVEVDIATMQRASESLTRLKEVSSHGGGGGGRNDYRETSRPEWRPL